MTRYEVDCAKCTNKALGDNGYIYCLPTRLNHKWMPLPKPYREDGEA